MNTVVYEHLSYHIYPIVVCALKVSFINFGVKIVSGGNYMYRWKAQSELVV